MTTTTELHPVDQMLPAPRLLALGLQHVLVMYAGAVAVPLIIGRALKLPPEDVAFLISADLFACGLATLVQCIGFPGRRYPAACDDGGDLRLGRPDAVDGRRARYRPARHLWFGHRCRNLRHHCRAFHQPAAAAVSARGHRNHHSGDRHLADAGGHQLGRWRPANPDQGGRWRPRRLPQSRLWPVAGARHRAVRAAGDPRPDQMGHRLRRQCRGAARHHRGRGARQRARRHAFRKGRERRNGARS